MDECSLKKDYSTLLRIKSESGTENECYPLMFEGLTEGDKLFAKRVLNETEENKEKGMRKLKEFMKNENLTCPDDSFLVIVLRNNKYDIKKSVSKLKRFLRVRQLTISKIVKMDLKKIEFILDAFICGPLPWRDRQGKLIIYSRANVQLDKLEMDDIVFYILALELFLLQFPKSSIYGLSYIADNKAPTISYFQILKCFHQVIPYLFDMPLRFVRVDIINGNFFSRWTLKIIRNILSEKINRRVMCHGTDLGNFHKLYHPDILPEELGGTLGPISSKYFRDELLKFIMRIKEENQNVQTVYHGEINN